MGQSYQGGIGMQPMGMGGMGMGQPIMGGMGMGMGQAIMGRLGMVQPMMRYPMMG